jgi:hypothetical protein
MPLLDDLRALLAVQAVDTRIGRARAQLAALDTGAATAQDYHRADAEAKTRRAAATRAQAEQHDAEMRLQSIEAKTAQVQKTLFSGTVTGPRELENLQKEVEMLGRQKDDAETRVLEAMDAAGAQVAAAEAAEAASAALADRYRAIRNAYKERHAVLAAEIAAGEAERAEAVRAVPAPLLARYDAIRAKKNNLAVVPLDADGTCGACHTKLNSGLTDAVRAATEAQTCEYCGRLLVPPPDEAA